MTLYALVLVLTAGFFHASWNLLAKRAGTDASGPAFVWLISAISALLLTPFAASRDLASGSAHRRPRVAVHVRYGAFCTSGTFSRCRPATRSGTLSLVYPLSRGTGPLLASAAAVLRLRGAARRVGRRRHPADRRERLLAGVGPEGWLREARPARRLGVFYGLLTAGRLIASYTLWDKYAVSRACCSRPSVPMGVQPGGGSPAHPRRTAQVGSRRRGVAAATAGVRWRGRALPTRLLFWCSRPWCSPPVSHVSPDQGGRHPYRHRVGGTVAGGRRTGTEARRRRGHRRCGSWPSPCRLGPTTKTAHRSPRRAVQFSLDRGRLARVLDAGTRSASGLC